jgi:hypothetical protein
MSVFDDWKGKPPAPEWRHWRLRKRINAWEAIALSMGIEPRAVRFDRHAWMTGGAPNLDAAFHDEAQADEYASRLQILADCIGDPEHFAPGALSLAGPHLHEVAVADFARWVRDVADWEAPSELVGMTGERTPLSPAESKGAPIARQLWQESAILDAISTLDLNPKDIAVTNGKRGPKAEIRTWLRARDGDAKWSESVFNKAWERLTESGSIRVRVIR